MPSKIEELKKATNLKDLANLLGVPPKRLSYILYIYAGPKYETFEIPKKKGGTRVIDAPVNRLKLIQRSLADLLSDCSSEIEKLHNRKPISHGFRKGRSIITNAKAHAGRRFVLNFDLQNFFPTVNFGRVRGFLIKNKDFQLHEKVATVIAQIACNGNALPQGSPCSPIIADLVAHILDVRLLQLAKQNRCTYSRYADDITFSTNQKEFPTNLATCADDGKTWTLNQPLIDAVTNAGFVINPEKTRMQCRVSRQSVTGLVVNKKVNVRDEYWRAARQMCHSLFTVGYYYRQDNPTPVGATYRIEGILNHINQIRSSSDSREDDVKNQKPLASYKLYQRLSFFRHFVALQRPLVLCEGPSDGSYLKTAIQQLAHKYPSLIDITVSPPKLKISFFNYKKQTKSLFRLTGGTDPIKTFMESYEAKIGEFRYRPLSFPLVVLLDNDSGTKKIFPFINGKYKLNASLKTTGPFYPVCHNLYVVKTPEKGATGESKIEDCFENALLMTPFNGKTFNADDDNLGPNEFGKVALSGIVRANASKINFAGFEPLLDRLVGAIKDYEAKAPALPFPKK